MSRVTVILPVRNGAEFIGEALRSLRGQSRLPEEILVIDDASTDGTASIVARTAPSARLLRGAGLGAAAARNLGIRHATGTLIGFIDHDDAWTPGRLERQVSLLDADPSLDAVLGTTQRAVLRRGQRRSDADGPEPRFEPLGAPVPEMSLGALLVRRDALERVGTFDGSRRFGEDVAWFATARSRGLRLRIDPHPAQIHRRHASNMTLDGAANRHGFFDALRAAARAQREVAVIVAVRNGERFIDDALASVAAQTHPPAEVLVVDGASEDRTREIAARHPFARVVVRAPAGVADANNLGVASTRSPLVAFLSHDDRWHPRKLELQVAALAADPALEMVVGHAAFELVPGCAPPPGFRLDLLDRPVPAFILETLLVRRAVLDRIGPFDATLRSAEDVDWFSRARHAGVRSRTLEEVLVRKRVHDRNTSLDAEANTARLLTVLRSAVRRTRRSEATT